MMIMLPEDAALRAAASWPWCDKGPCILHFSADVACRPPARRNGGLCLVRLWTEMSAVLHSLDVLLTDCSVVLL